MNNRGLFSKTKQLVWTLFLNLWFHQTWVRQEFPFLNSVLVRQLSDLLYLSTFSCLGRSPYLILTPSLKKSSEKARVWLKPYSVPLEILLEAQVEIITNKVLDMSEQRTGSSEILTSNNASSCHMRSSHVAGFRSPWRSDFSNDWKMLKAGQFSYRAIKNFPSYN